MSTQPLTDHRPTKRDLAKQIAQFVHKDQTDKSGRPYLEHVEKVANSAANSVLERARNQSTFFGVLNPDLPRVTISDTWIAGILHDVVEDSHINIESIENIFGETIGQAVYLLTRYPDCETHAEYIEYIAEGEGAAGEIARIVKRSDLIHNLSEERRFPGDKSLRQRYIKALAVLG